MNAPVVAPRWPDAANFGEDAAMRQMHVQTLRNTGALERGGRSWTALCGSRTLAALALAACLSGCVEQLADLRPGGGEATQVTAGLPVPSNIARRADVSPGGVVVALASLDGPPQAISAQFAQALVAQAGPREIVLGEAAKARYLVRGYLSAYAVEGGTAFGYVWDVFETGKARAQRLTDAVVIKDSNAADPWSLAGEAVLTSLAAKSADDIAAFLSNTPEAIAAAKLDKTHVAGTPLATKPLGYAADQ